MTEVDVDHVDVVPIRALDVEDYMTVEQVVDVDDVATVHHLFEARLGPNVWHDRRRSLTSGVPSGPGLASLDECAHLICRRSVP